MTESLLLDTHIALWLDSGDERLRDRTRAVIDACWHTGGVIHLSAVSAWEIAVLVEGGCIVLDIPAERWLARFIERPGFSAVPLDFAITCRAYQLHRLEHREPADRLLIATAIGLERPLITYDERITHFADRYGTQLGLSAIA